MECQSEKPLLATEEGRGLDPSPGLLELGQVLEQEGTVLLGQELQGSRWSCPHLILMSEKQSSSWRKDTDELQRLVSVLLGLAPATLPPVL
jgi:hypothetical protein